MAGGGRRPAACWLAALVSFGLVRSAAPFSACPPLRLARVVPAQRVGRLTPALRPATRPVGAGVLRRGHAARRARCSAAEGAGAGAGAGLHIVFQDEHLAVVSKPGGMLMHRSRDAGRETVFLLQTVRDQLGKHVFFVNRIDRGTSGMVVMAFDGPTAARLQTALAAPEASKECECHPPCYRPRRCTLCAVRPPRAH